MVLNKGLAIFTGVSQVCWVSPGGLSFLARLTRMNVWANPHSCKSTQNKNHNYDKRLFPVCPGQPISLVIPPWFVKKMGGLADLQNLVKIAGVIPRSNYI